jgi:hypothetical protein
LVFNEPEFPLFNRLATLFDPAVCFSKVTLKLSRLLFYPLGCKLDEFTNHTPHLMSPALTFENQKAPLKKGAKGLL